MHVNREISGIGLDLSSDGVSGLNDVNPLIVPNYRVPSLALNDEFWLNLSSGKPSILVNT